MMPKNITAFIKAKKELSPDTFSLELRVPGLKLRPGNFFQVRTADTFDPYLSRPISVAGYKKSSLLMIIRRVGRGTGLLHEKNVGDRLSILGPMGKGVVTGKKRTLLIAGGIGIAPLYYLAHDLVSKRIEFSLIYGVRNRGDHILISELKRICPSIFLVCEHGMKKKMTALDMLKKMTLVKYDIIYACGPRAMFIELQKMELNLPIYVFYEDFLGCGCGICIGCAIKINREYRRICTDGPVFNLREISFDNR